MSLVSKRLFQSSYYTLVSFCCFYFKLFGVILMGDVSDGGSHITGVLDLKLQE